MYSILLSGLLSISFASSSFAAPSSRSTLIEVSISSKTTSTLTSSFAAAISSIAPNPADFFSAIVPKIQYDLPITLKNAAQPTNNASISIPPFTARLPAAPTVTPVLIADYTPSWHHNFTYTVPNTRTNLSITLANPDQLPSLDPVGMAQTLISLHNTLQARLNATGDRWLNEHEEDPLGWDIGRGCWLEFWSNPDRGPSGRREHLTLGVMVAVLDGLMERLVWKGLYDFAYVEIVDGEWGILGMGFVAPDVGAVDGQTNQVSSVLDTLRIEGKRKKKMKKTR